MKNRGFRLKGASWIIWACCWAYIRGPPQLSYLQVSNVLELGLPVLNGVLNRSLPASLGDCRSLEFAPPAPCVGEAPLFAERLASGHASSIGLGSQTDVLVRWVAGANTIRLHDASFRVVKDAPKPIQVEFRGSIKDLKASIRVQQCILTVCNTVWDNTEGCCEPDRGFELIIAASCLGSAAGSKVLGDFEVEWFNIDGFTLTKALGEGLAEEVAFLTPKVKHTVQKVIMDALNHQAVLQSLSFTEVVSQLWRYNMASGETQCPDVVLPMEPTRPYAP